MKLNFYKWLIVLIMALALCAFFYFDLSTYLQLDYVKENREKLFSLYSVHPLLTSVTYFSLYVLATALSVPGALVLTVFSGFLFGLIKGTLLVSFASTFGATLSFLISRFLLREALTQKFGNKLAQISHHLEKEGAFYLFTLRLIPVIPFFLINILMGLSPLRTKTFFIVSQIGMLPMTLVYVNAGNQLAQIDNLKDLLSPSLLVSMVLVVCSSFVIKTVWNYISIKRGTKKS